MTGESGTNGDIFRFSQFQTGEQSMRDWYYYVGGSSDSSSGMLRLLAIIIAFLVILNTVLWLFG
jgi:hypothetical protein